MLYHASRHLLQTPRSVPLRSLFNAPLLHEKRHGIIERLNSSLERYPISSISCFIAGDVVTMYSMYSLISLVPGLHFSSQFVFAFSCSRLLRRPRLPLDIVTAGSLSFLFPSLQRIDITSVLKHMNKKEEDSSEKPTRVGKLFRSISMKTKNVFEHHGASYLIASRMNGVLTVLSIYALSLQGFDISHFLQDMGLGAVDQAGYFFGPWAAAVVFSSALFPLTSSISVGFIAPTISNFLKSKNGTA